MIKTPFKTLNEYEINFFKFSNAHFTDLVDLKEEKTSSKQIAKNMNSIYILFDQRVLFWTESQCLEAHCF
jgi:hypothetical protein